MSRSTALLGAVTALSTLIALAGCPAEVPDGQDGGMDGGTADSGMGDAGAEDGGLHPLEGVLLDYDWGNQINGSSLSLTAADGGLTLERRERTCCPPEVLDAGVPELDGLRAQTLLGWIRDCRGQSVEQTAVDGGALGGSSGRLLLFPDAGSRTTVVMEIERAIGQDLVRKNVCASRIPLLQFVNDIVTVDAPLD